jgi:peroxiredoxin
MKKLLMQVVALCVLSLLVLSSQHVAASASLNRESLQGAAAPNFTLATVSGKSVSLKELKGKSVILFFFTTWCPYCREKFPTLAKEYDKYRDEGIELLAINGGETKAKVSSFMSKEQASIDVLLDSGLKTAESYGVIGVPTFILISKDGIVVYEGNDLPRNYKELLSK